MKKIPEVGFILCLLILHLTAKSINPLIMKDLKTIYTITMTGQNAGCKLRVNDIPVISSDYAGKISKFPINPWLINGRNTFTLQMQPEDSASKNHPDFVLTDMTCKVAIAEIKDSGMPDSTIVQAEVNGSVADSAPSIDGNFSISLGFSQPPWAQSGKIGQDDATQSRILEKYREFYHLLERKDLNGILKFSFLKFQEYSKSMYDPEFISDKRVSFSEEFKSPPGYLIGIDEQKKFGLQYEYYFGDRLVTINNDENRSIIQYYNEEDGVTTQYRLFFYFDGNDFILIL